MAIGGFGGNIFSGIDATFVFWAIAFLILLGVTNFVFTKFFKKQKVIGTIVAVLVSIAIVYYSSLKYPGFLDNVFYGLGIDPAQILSILPWVGAGAAILILVIWGIGMLLMVVGLILIITGLTNLAYDPMIPIMIGVIVFIIGLGLWWRKKKKKTRGPRPPKDKNPPGDLPPDEKKKRKVRLLIQIKGKGKLNFIQGMYHLRSGKKVKIKIRKGQIKYWSINGANYGKRNSINLKMDRDYRIVAVFGKDAEKQEEDDKEDKSGGDNKNNLARKLGIKKLQKEYLDLTKEYEKGLITAKELHKKATKLGWTSASRKGPRQGESDSAFNTRTKQANETYKEWYRQYNRNIQIQKQSKELKDRIEHLQKRIN